MTKKIGIFTTGANADSYLYIETPAGESYSVGSDNLTDNLCVNSSTTPGSIPDESTANITVSSNANGDIDFFPNGTGKTAVLKGNLEVTAGNLLIPSTTSINQGVIYMGGSTWLHGAPQISDANIFLGQNSGNFTLTAGVALANTIVGGQSARVLTTGNSNSSLGLNTLIGLTTGNSNLALGITALSDLVSGSNNIVIGTNAGNQYNTSESNNITVNAAGTSGESNIMRLGTSGSGTNQVNTTYIAGINGVNVGSVASVVSISGDKLGLTTITAGTNITVTPGANTITIAANAGSEVVEYVSVNHAASPYTALSTDYYISADVTAGVISIRLPNAPSSGRVFIVKDKVGLAGTSNITVTTVGGAVTIDGATTYVMNTAYESAEFIFNGTSYEIF